MRGPPVTTDAGMPLCRGRAVIVNERGLHARASAKFVTLARQFQAEIRVTREGTTVVGTSIMGLLMLGAGIGCEIELEAQGPDAEAALAAVLDLIARGFDEGVG